MDNNSKYINGVVIPVIVRNQYKTEIGGENPSNHQN